MTLLMPLLSNLSSVLDLSGISANSERLGLHASSANAEPPAPRTKRSREAPRGTFSPALASVRVRSPLGTWRTPESSDAPNHESFALPRGIGREPHA
jgi:hypothetical protein